MARCAASAPQENTTATNQLRERERADMPGDATDDDTRTGVPAERGQPEAEHGQYGLVREDSDNAKGLTERQIRGVDPKP